MTIREFENWMYFVIILALLWFFLSDIFWWNFVENFETCKNFWKIVKNIKLLFWYDIKKETLTEKLFLNNNTYLYILIYTLNNLLNNYRIDKSLF